MRRVDVLRGWRERWDRAEVKPVARRLTAELLDGRLETRSPFGEVDGRADLRGLQVDVLASRHDPMYERHSVDGGHWHALDLSGAGLSALNWTGLRISDCVLVDAQLDDLRCWGVEVVDCSAQRASLRGAQIGAPAPGLPTSSWRRVDLRGADLRRLHCTARLEDLDLARAKFRNTDLGWSDLARLHFEGAVHTLAIGDLHADRRPPTWQLADVDLRKARLHDLRLIAVDLGSPSVDIRLPDDDEQWLIDDWPRFLERVGSAAPEGLRTLVEVWVDHERRYLGPHQTRGFTTRRDAVAFAGEAFAEHLQACR